MAEPSYSTQVHVKGGRNGVGRTKDGQFEVELKGPVELGGEGGGANPEQLFGIGFAACFESSLRGTARRLKLDPKGTEIDATVMLFPRPEGGSKLGVTMDIVMPNLPDQETAFELVKTAHQRCPYSHATRGNIDVAYSINGEPVAVE